MPMRPCLIAAGSFSTCLSVEDDSTHREIIIDSGYFDQQSHHSPPSPLLYHIFAANLASIVRPYRDCNKRTPAISAWKTLQALQLLEASLPAHLSKPLLEDVAIGRMQSSWVSTQRSLCIDLLQICRVSICLVALPEILETKQDEYDLKRFGRQAASILIDHRRYDSTPYFGRLWGPKRSIWAAGIYLALDLICFAREKSPQETEEQLQRITLVFEILSTESEQAQSQTQVLMRLLEIYNQSKNINLTGKDDLFHIMDSVASPDRVISNDGAYMAQNPLEHSGADATYMHSNLDQLLDVHAWGSDGFDSSMEFNEPTFDLFSHSHEMTGWWLSSQLSGFPASNGA